MPTNAKSIHPTLKLLAILFAATLAGGCVSAKSKPAETAAPAEPAEPVVEAPAPAPAPVPEAPPAPEAPPVLTAWTVVAGNHLWGISGEEAVYNVPEKWPLLYKSNIDQIEDADLIFPGQVLDIPRDSSLTEVDAAIGHAKNRGAWAVGPVELSDQEYLKNPG